MKIFHIGTGQGVPLQKNLCTMLFRKKILRKITKDQNFDFFDTKDQKSSIRKIFLKNTKRKTYEKFYNQKRTKNSLYLQEFY